MPKFDLAETHEFTSRLNLQLDQCDNGEGFECATLDETLINYGIHCYRFAFGVNHWARAVFSGETPFIAEVETAWRTEGQRLLDRARRMRAKAEMAEVLCYQLDGKAVLDLALKDLGRLLENWVTPKLAVAPSARRRDPLPDAVVDDARQRILALPPLPKDWLQGCGPDQGCANKES